MSKRARRSQKRRSPSIVAEITADDGHASSQQPAIMTGRPEGRYEDLFAKERARAREDFERQKEKLVADTEKSRPSNARFVGQNDSMEDSLKKSTVGLVHLQDFQQRRIALEEEKARAAAKTDALKYVLIIYKMCEGMAYRAWRCV